MPNQFSQWGKLGGRPRLYLNSAHKQKAYRLRKLQAKLQLLNLQEKLKPAVARIIWVLDQTKIVEFKKAKSLKRSISIKHKQKNT